MSEPAEQRDSRAATFFDVDGTLVETTIAHYYAYFRRTRLPAVIRHLWFAWYVAKCGYYVVLDKINRSRMNVVFYRSYRGLPADEIKTKSWDCYRRVMEPRRFREAAPCIERHRSAGRRIVLVTGSIDFIVAPLAEEVGADDVLAPVLVEAGGRFTGDLGGPPIGEEEKARRIREFAACDGIDLSESYAYGDSIADLPMLEAVGHPAVVNPDKALAAVAAARGWPVLTWTVGSSPEDNGR